MPARRTVGPRDAPSRPRRMAPSSGNDSGASRQHALARDVRTAPGWSPAREGADMTPTDAPTTSAAGPMTCSQLSTSSKRIATAQPLDQPLDRVHRTALAGHVEHMPVERPSTAPKACTTPVSSVTGARSTNQAREPGCSRRLLDQLGRQPRLARAARADERDRARPSEAASTAEQPRRRGRPTESKRRRMLDRRLPVVQLDGSAQETRDATPEHRTRDHFPARRRAALDDSRTPRAPRGYDLTGPRQRINSSTKSSRSGCAVTSS